MFEYFRSVYKGIESVWFKILFQTDMGAVQPVLSIIVVIFRQRACLHTWLCLWSVGGWVDQKVWSSGKFPIRDIVVQGNDLDELEEVKIL